MYKAHTGQTFQIRNLKIEAMMSVETIHPTTPDCYNSTSLITRFTAGEGDNAQTLMILGDTQDGGSKRLVEIYGEALKCDLLQLAHHGMGGSIDLYKLCAPSVVLCPHRQNRMSGDLRPGNTGKYPTINQSLCNQQNVVLIVVADKGHKTITLPLLGLTTDEKQNQTLVTVTPRFDGK